MQPSIKNHDRWAVHKIVAPYIAFGILWIYLSDTVMYQFIRDPALLTHYAIYKGILFIFLTAFLLYVLVARFVRHSRNTELLLRQSEEKYRTLIETTGTGYVIIDSEGKVLDANREYVRLSGHTSLSEILGHGVTEWTAQHDLARNAEEVIKCMEKGFVSNLEIDYVNQEGRYTPIEINASVLKTSEGAKIITLCRDITERKRTDEEIRRLNTELEERVIERTSQLVEAYREQESFSYSVSHDLRAPLRHINSYSAILLEDYGENLPGQASHYLDRIRNASSRMGNLIDDLLELSRISRGELKLKSVNLSKIAREVATMLQEAEPYRTVEFGIDKGLTARGDYNLLKIALQNLLGNAWKYTSKMPAARIEFGVTTIEGRKAFFVRDNGVGFDMAYADKLFGAFQRLHGEEFEGTGIGLATVQRIIKRLGGRVWADAEVGKGATFYFTCHHRTDISINNKRKKGRCATGYPPNRL